MVNQVIGGVLEATHLSASAIEAMAAKELLAVRVRDYCGVDVCVHAMRRLGGMVGYGYRAEPNFRKLVGGALFDSAGCEPTAFANYFGSAARWYAACKQVFAPYISPVDKMRGDLQAIWPAGSCIERIGGRLAFAGVIRGLRTGAEARPHQDMTNWDLPDIAEAQTLKTQLSCLTYLSCADSGGQLELWAREIESQSEYENCKSPGSYGLDRHRIGSWDAVISPMVGELIVFNARRIHAVRRIAGGLRCSQSFFIGYRGSDQPLSLFS
jgi:putative hemolysin